MAQKQVVIVGGGFGGIKAALELSKHDQFRVTLISDRDTFRYYPSLYHTATGGSRYVSTIPLGEIFGGKKVSVVTDTVTSIDREGKTVKTADGRDIDFDHLILALGVVTNYFGIKGLQEFSFGIKSLEEATELKEHLQEQLIDQRRPDLNYIVIGGGPSGVELAGMLPSYIKWLMRKHGIKGRAFHIDLVEAAPRILPRSPETVSRSVTKRLKRLGVKVITGKPVQAETADALLVGGKPIRSHTVIWTAGVTNHPFFAGNKFLMAQNGKVQVDKYLRAWPNIYVIGDNASTPYSGMAQTALHDAHYVSRSLIAKSRGKKPKPYAPKKPIYVTPAGPKWAAVVWGPLHLYGRLGWWFRRAADWIGYRDVEPWWKASARFMAENIKED
jgi:NADH dehydrogenase